ncbi:DUF6292 family protein [Streptomyces sp. NPDC058471]|uniref:DUF6292 family protein n=1 Tax=Streptomyces sp. NPDC058471 TaxID=3346516 RepID=UPI00364F26FB
MIRAGRRSFVQNSADLAAAMGLKIGSFRNQQPYEQDGFPATISPPEAKSKLWDSEQTAAYLAGNPVPALPQTDDDEDLLERTEAAAALDVTPKTWDSYKKDPRIAPHLVKVKGVEHCPRGVLRAFRDPVPAQDRAPSHRPKGSGDMVPRDELEPRVGELLDADPGLTLATVQEQLGVSYSTAARVLPRLRGERIADQLAAQRDLTPQQAARRLGYPASVHHTAIGHARTELRGRAFRRYVQAVADELAAAGLAQEQDVAMVHVADDAVAAAVVLSANAPAPALVWDERYGWRTATSRRHPIGRDTGRPPEGEGVRYLGPNLRPPGEGVLAAVYDGRRGTRRPTGAHPAGA